jgi:hypothetical protein
MIANHWVNLETGWPPIVGKESEIQLGQDRLTLAEVALGIFFGDGFFVPIGGWGSIYPFRLG